jgi:hypothetical protein
MKHVFLILVIAASVRAENNPAQRVADDAMVIDRVAEVSGKRDLPRDLLKRIVEEDVDLLRGKRPDGSYEYASWERFEAGRVSNSFSIQPRTDKMESVEIKGTWVYRIVVEIPAHRLLVRKNRPIWIERVDVDYVGEGATTSQQQSFEVKAWMQPEEVRPIDLPVIARQVTVKVIATADPKGGYGNVDVALVQAKIVDKEDSPYADAMTSAKAMQRALDNAEIPSLRAMAQRVRASVGGTTAMTAPVPARPATAEAAVVTQKLQPDLAQRLETQAELQLIEDLLTGTENERRDGLDRLHQMIRRLRP